MERRKFNTAVVQKCIELLKSDNEEEQAEGVLKAAYLIEQSFKLEIRSINPLLYFDTRKLNAKTIAKVAANKLSVEELLKLQTVQARDLIEQICELRTDLEPSFANFEALCAIRNKLMHSVDNIPNIKGEVETAVSALRAAAAYVQKCADAKGFNPLTSKEFQDYQAKIRSEHEDKLLERVYKHRKIFEDIEAEGMIENHQANNRDRIICDGDTWIEETIDCPACAQNTLHLIVSVGFEYDDGVILGGSSAEWYCQTCELELSQYELELVQEKMAKKK
jgi:hypothetical protein